jgi:hypothetical protein
MHLRKVTPPPAAAPAVAAVAEPLLLELATLMPQRTPTLLNQMTHRRTTVVVASATASADADATTTSMA